MEIMLEKNELLDLGRDLRNLTVSCLAGCCWLTQSGDSRDHILRPGTNVTIGSSGKVVITATEDCRIQVQNSALLERCSFRQQLSCNG